MQDKFLGQSCRKSGASSVSALRGKLANLSNATAPRILTTMYHHTRGQIEALRFCLEHSSHWHITLVQTYFSKIFQSFLFKLIKIRAFKKGENTIKLECKFFHATFLFLLQGRTKYCRKRKKHHISSAMCYYFSFCTEKEGNSCMLVLLYIFVHFFII